MAAKPFSQACENNKQPILEVLQQYLQQGQLLEIGSGTGQHASWFAPRLPRIQWQPSDLPDALPGILQWLDNKPANLKKPLVLDVAGRWPNETWDYIFTANTFHIMPEQSVATCIEAAASKLNQQGLFLVYGPFRFCGHYTSPSNAHFDQWLKQRNPRSGIRDFEAIEQQMSQNGLELLKNLDMPANNQFLIWQRQG